MENTGLERTPFVASVVTSDSGPVGKQYSLEDGKLVSRTAVGLTSGRIQRQNFSSLSEFMRARSRLEPHQALTMGVAEYPLAQIVTQDALKHIPAERRSAQKIIARDSQHMAWYPGPATVMIDIDQPEGIPEQFMSAPPKTPEEWRDRLVELIPALSECPMAWAPSSSSFISVEGEEVFGLRGQRFYVVLASGLNTPNFAQTLEDQSALRGWVWFTVGKTGRRLKRFPFDMAVYQPERLDFAAAPECYPPASHREVEPKVWNDAGPWLRLVDLPATTPTERRNIEATIQNRRGAVQAEALAAKERWVRERGAHIALSNVDLTTEQAHSVAQRALKRRQLGPDFVLTDSDGNTVRVGELLAAPQENHGRRFHDPLEPGYRNDPRIAVFLVDERGRARIYSHAHGGQSFECPPGDITIVLGQLDQTVDQIVQALSQDNAGIYRSGTTLVGVDEANAKLTPLDSDGLALRIQRSCDVRGMTKSGLTPKDLPSRAIRAMMSDVAALPLPDVTAVVSAPLVRKDGSVLDRPGHDPSTRVIYAPASPAIGSLRAGLTNRLAEETLAFLWHPLSGFTFESPAARGAALAALLTSACREAIETAPGYLLTASTAGTGKTTLARTIGAVYTGGSIALASMPQSDEEVRKHLFAAVRAGSRFLVYDNAERGADIDSTALAALVTSSVVEGRILGESRIAVLPHRVTAVITGNNVTLRGDLNRRLIRIPLEADREYPWTKSYDFDPVEYVQSRWSRLRIAAAELLVEARRAGVHAPTEASGFTEWDTLVRSTIEWIIQSLHVGVEFADPIRLMKESYEEDSESEALGGLLRSLSATFRDAEFTVNEVEKKIHAYGANQSPAVEQLRVARGMIVGTDRPQRNAAELGRYFSKYEKKIVGDLRLERRGKTSGRVRWAVRSIKEAKPS